MKHIWIVPLTIFLMAHVSLQAATQTDLFYHAGVVEFKPSYELLNSDRLRDNLRGYIEIISSTKSLDIIVFPESTLNNDDETTFVPNPEELKTAPCDSSTNQYHDLLIQLSCAARKSSTYLVINLTEKEKCSPLDKRPCAPTGLNLYNTNVVFDRLGVVISRYRKVNLYSGENKNTTLTPELGWFDTDFGVRFGHFICYDILFYSPTQELVEKFGIQDFIFPTMWFSQLPFLTAVQFHQAWSFGNDVNFLAAGASNPSVGSTGSGIYNGRRGIVVATMQQEEGQRKLYTAQVPKFQKRFLKMTRTNSATQNNSTALRTTSAGGEATKSELELKTDHLQSYNSILIDLYNQTSLSQELCYSETSALCCRFELVWQKIVNQNHSHHYYYRLGVYAGQRYEEGVDSNQLKNCAVFSCVGPNILDCGKVLDHIDLDVVFENVTITGLFPRTETFLLMPNSLVHEGLMPIPANDFEWTQSVEEEEDKLIRIWYSLKANASNLMTFSIYGNYYDSVFEDDIDDGDGDGDGHGVFDGNNGASSLAVTVAGGFLVTLIQFIFSM